MVSNSTDPSDYCTLGTCPLSEANFTYVPSLGGNVSYLSIFGLILLAQFVLGIRYRTWGFLVCMSGGLILEIIGYIGRVQLHYNPFPFDPFLEYLICLTIGPAFLSAAIYLCLGRIVVVYGEGISRIRPRTYTLIFVVSDFISLVLQAAGGAVTATADEDQPDLNQDGINIMLAGLASQVASLIVFMALCIEYALNVRKSPQQLNSSFSGLRQTWMWKLFPYALAAATTTIFVRCVYRVAELSGGFNGHLANDETTFMILEGPMIIIACACLTIFHPGLCFGGRWHQANWSLGKPNQLKGAERESKTAIVDYQDAQP